MWLHGHDLAENIEKPAYAAQYWPLWSFSVFWPEEIYRNRRIATKINATPKDRTLQLWVCRACMRYCLCEIALFYTLVFMLCHGWFYTQNLCGSSGQNFFYRAVSTNIYSAILTNICSHFDHSTKSSTLIPSEAFLLSCRLLFSFLIVMDPISIILVSFCHPHTK